jgi:peptidoglycan hydrolase-like protein with peptidoglycan-binding domain
MRSGLIIGVSVIALSLGGCSWVERTTGIGNGQSPAQAQSAPLTPVPNGGPAYVTPGGMAQTSANTPANTKAPARASAHRLVASNTVREAQEKLKSDGDYKGKIDGLAGPQTHKALASYQTKNDLKKTGRLDMETREKLGLVASNTMTKPTTASSHGSASATNTPAAPPAPAPASAPAPAANPPAGTKQ